MKQCILIETMEHLCECEHYSELLWLRLGGLLTQHLNTRAANLVLRVDLGQTIIIFNIPINFFSYRHHLQGDESGPLVTISNSHSVIRSSFRLYFTEATFISTINVYWSQYLNCKKHTEKILPSSTPTGEICSVYTSPSPVYSIVARGFHNTLY